ncbi:MAG: nitrate reductase cytochrome c-type subunit [Flavobacteriales bacterium]|nr:nitrate reductase cytochrome c-type subunit [Flavobacteriales bacterium]
MKLTKISLGLFSIAAIFIIGCSKPQMLSEKSLGLRNTSLYTEVDVVPIKTQYTKKAPGESTLIERAYENAPPMIPHDVEGLLPITANNNTCMGCHTPLVAKSLNATPIPQSHFTSFRPETSLSKDGQIIKNGILINNTSDIKASRKDLDSLSFSRFNCSACHVPQSLTKISVENKFIPEFRMKDGNKKSNLITNINEGVNLSK